MSRIIYICHTTRGQHLWDITHVSKRNMQDNIHTGNEKLIVGIAKATSTIRPTYGAAGGNQILEESVYPFHSVRNDGKAIMDKVKLADPAENAGANIMKQACDRADKDSSDGRKTTAILTEAIFIEAQKVSAFPMNIKRSLDECVPILMKAIDDSKRAIELSDVKAVATIASESEEIGALMQEIYEKIGKEGIVEVENANLPKTYYEITEGVRLRNAGYIGGYANTELGKAVYKNPKILITKDKISSVDQLEPIFGMLMQNGINELVIYCDDIDLSVASKLAYTHLTGGFKTLVIKSPNLWKDLLFEDFAAITGATIVDSANGIGFTDVTLDTLGTCSKIISTDSETRVVGIKDISQHVAKLEAENTDQSKLRLSWLNTKVAILKVGASSETELSYVLKKAKDACHSSYLALKDGVVAGGGLSMANLASCLPRTIGGDILSVALQAPMAQIALNAGITITGQGGIDARTGDLVPDMFEAGIVDPALVIKNAIRNSISIASTVISSCGIITLPEQKHDNAKMPSL